MKQIILFLTSVIFANSCAAAGRWLETEDGNRLYIETQNKFNWFEAISKCAQRNMSLISMDSPNKTLELDNLIVTNFGNSYTWIWTGGHDHNVSRHFEWISNGEAFGYTNWQTSEPDNVNHRCVHMLTGSSLKWFDYDCNYKCGFVCEENTLQKLRNTECAILKASSENQTSLLKEKTEQLDSLQEEFKKSQKIQTNLKMEYDELQKLYEQGLEEIKHKEDEFINLQKTSEQQMTQLNQNQRELNAMKAQLTSDIEIRQLLKDMQKDLVSVKSNSESQSQIIDTFTKSCEIKHSESKSITYEAALLKARTEELEALKRTHEMQINQCNTFLKSYELNTNRSISNKYYNIHFNKNSN